MTQFDYPLAILSSNMRNTIEWIKKEYDVKQINMFENRVELVNGKILYIVTNQTMLLGHTFSDYRRAPDFETLEDLVKSRIIK